MMPTSDPTLERVVHAMSGDTPAGELVRYDKAGKWYIEWPGRSLMPAQHVTIAQAADMAVFWMSNGGCIFPRQYGGTRFVSELRKRGVTPSS